jgi:hypothetical protein
VLRRSTTDWTWDKQRSSFARSMVAFIATQTPLRGAKLKSGAGIAHKRRNTSQYP